MTIFKLIASIALAITMTVAVQPAEAGRRINCLCNGKDKSWIHHNHACEIHFKKPMTKKAGGGSKPATSCTMQEFAQFRTYLCVNDGCTYPYVRSADAKVPLNAK